MKKFALLAAIVIAGCTPYVRTTEAYDPTKMTGYFDIYRPIGQDTTLLPCVMFIHGGAFEMGDKQGAADYAEVLCPKGYVVVSPNYRLSSNGFHWPAQIGDVQEAMQYVVSQANNLHIKTPISVMGVSAGGCLALLLHLGPNNPASACCVDISGESDFNLPDNGMGNNIAIMTSLIGTGPPWTKAQLAAMSPLSFVNKNAHVLILHSTLDSNVFVANGDELDAALKAVQAEVVYDRPVGYAHGDDLWNQYPKSHDETVNFFDLHKPK
jgi:acetyl esterase/lipase